MRDKDFAELVALMRTPLGWLVDEVVAADGDQARIDAALTGAAEGLADAFWDGVATALETGKTIERFKRIKVGGVPS